MEKKENYCKDCKYCYFIAGKLRCGLTAHGYFPGFTTGEYDECNQWEPKEGK